MVLRPQTIDVPFGLGLDQGTDSKNVLPGKLATLENACFDKLGRVAKRPGIISDSGFGANGLLFGDDDFLYMRDLITGDQIIRGAAGNSAIRTARNYVFPRLVGDPIATPTNDAVGSVRTVDLAMDQVGKRYGLAITQDASAGLSLTAIDYNTMKPIASQVVSVSPLSDTYHGASRVLPNGTADQFMIGTVEATNVFQIRSGITPSGTSPALTGGATNAFTIPAASVTLNVNGTTSAWDWCVLGNILYVAYLDTAGTSIVINKYTIGTWAATSATFAVANVKSIALSANATANLVGVIWGTTTNTSLRTYNATTMAAVTAATVIYTPSIGPNFDTINVTAYVDTAAIYFATEENTGGAGLTYQEVTTFGSCSLTGTSIVTSQLRGVGLATKVSSSKFIGCVFDTPLQRQLVFYNFDTRSIGGMYALAGRINYGFNGGLTQQQSLPYMNELSRNGVDNTLICGTLVSLASTATAANSTRTYTAGYAEALLPGQVPYPQANMSGRGFFGGGYLHTHGPYGPMSPGFLAFPEVISATPSASGGSLADGTYGLVFTLEWTDDRGEVIESAPSPPVFATVAGGGGAGSISSSVNVQRFDPIRMLAAGVTNTSPKVYVVEYRQVVGGTHYYREKRVLLTNSNLITVTATIAAATLQQFAVNTQAENLEAFATMPDCPVALASDTGRMWCVPGSARNKVIPSKPKLPGVGLEFFPDTYREVSTSSAGVNALARMDGKVLAFKADCSFVASGDGPDATGANDTLGQFVDLYKHVGAESFNAVVLSNGGVFVKDSTTIWQIGRDLQLQRVGLDVENLTTTPVMSSANCHLRQEIHFLLGNQSGTCTELVYDETVKQWAVWTRPANGGVRPCIVEFGTNVFYQLGGPVVGTLGGLSDVGANIAMKVVTAWLKPGNVLAGFGRIYSAMLLGGGIEIGEPTIQVRVGFDYDETLWPETHTFGNYFTVNMEHEIMFTNQKCEAFHLEITETSNNQSPSFDGLTLLVGAKGGKNRQAEAMRG